MSVKSPVHSSTMSTPRPSRAAPSDPEREEKARAIAAYMELPLEIHDLGIAPLDDLLTPLLEPSDLEDADAVRP